MKATIYLTFARIVASIILAVLSQRWNLEGPFVSSILGRFDAEEKFDLIILVSRLGDGNHLQGYTGFF